jgi:hypothetical protein
VIAKAGRFFYFLRLNQRVVNALTIISVIPQQALRTAAVTTIDEEHLHYNGAASPKFNSKSRTTEMV